MTPAELSFDCTTPEATQKFGHDLGQLLFPGAVVALVGPLGAGKTFLARAITEGLGIDNPDQVTSPTFVLIQEYQARLPIYHFDVYRLKRGSEFVDLGAMEYLSGEGVCLVEWADKVEALLPVEHLRVELAVAGDTSRRITVRAIGDKYQNIAHTL